MKQRMSIFGVFIGMIFLAALSPNVVTGTNVSGIISSDTTWTKASSPYIVVGGVLANSGVTLTIEPGVQVKFNSGLSLQIDGTLIAQGTSSDKIIFTTNSLGNYWGYIYFSDSSTDATYDGSGNYTSGCILEYCLVEYAGGASVSDNAAVRMDNSSPFTNHCTIRSNNARGINVINGTNTIITSSMISNNTTSQSWGGGGIYTSGTVTISDCIVTNNVVSIDHCAGCGGGGIFADGGDITIGNCTVSGNTATAGDNSTFNGGGIYTYAADANITNCTIMNNTVNGNGGGIYTGSDIVSTVAISGNLISNNTSEEGGGIYTYKDKVNISNNIIISNGASNSGGGIYNWDSLVANVSNIICSNIALGNGGGIYSKNIIKTSKNTISNNTSLNASAVRWAGSTDFNHNTITCNKATGVAPTYAIYVLSSPLFNYNNLYGNSNTYEFWNANAQGSLNVDAENNWWGTQTESVIQALIYDWFDDATKGIVDYTPFETSIRTDCPISPPSGLTATGGVNSIDLDWNANPEGDLAGYNIYWDTTSNGYSYANMTDVGNVTSYTISGLNPGNYYVTVTAYDTDFNEASDLPDTIVNDNQTAGHESWYAEEKSATVRVITPTPPPTPIPPATPTVPPLPTATPPAISVPTGLKALPGAESIKLTWSPNPEPDLDGYNVYRSTSAGGTYAQINSSLVQDTEYTDSGHSVGETYYYKITAVNTSSQESEKTDYVYATVGSIVAWMPDYRGKAGEEVTLLINATNATGVSNNGIDVQFTYDTDLLTPISQVDPTKNTVEKTALTNGFLTMDNSSIAAGQLNISGVGAGMTVVGEGHLFDIKFKVSDSAGGGETGSHIFVVVKFKDINGDNLLVDYSDTAIFTVALNYMLGDVNGDGVVDSGDAIVCLRIATGEITPTPEQRLAADINGDGEIDSADAILILRLAVGLPVNPPQGVRRGEEASWAATSYTLTVGQSTGVSPGQTIRIPISIDDASDFAGADLRVNYNPSIVTALGAYTTTLSSGFSLKYHIGSSWVDVAMGTSENLTGGSGSLAELEFKVNAGASPGSSSPLTLSQRKLSRQYGENVAWEDTVNFVNGSITLAGVASTPTPQAATPTPTPQLLSGTIESGDYDGDGSSDVAIFRSGGGMWAVRGITRAYLGTSGDLPVSGDYDGDGSSDIAVFRSGLWAIRDVSRVYLGASGDLPVPGDYDGDGRCDAGIFRSGLWAIRNVTRAYLGTSGDCIASGDYDGDGRCDIGIFRSGLWALRGLSRIYLGTSGDLPVPGDYAGDGTWEPGIFRYGLWAIRNLTRAYLGTSGDLPVPADYDGLGEDEIGIFRGSAGLWAIKGVSRVYFGTGGDIPVTR